MTATSRVHANPASQPLPTVEVPVLQKDVQYFINDRNYDDARMADTIKRASAQNGLVIFKVRLRGFVGEIHVIGRTFTSTTTGLSFTGIVMQPGPVKVLGSLFGDDQGHIRLA